MEVKDNFPPKEYCYKIDFDKDPRVWIHTWIYAEIIEGKVETHNSINKKLNWTISYLIVEANKTLYVKENS